MLNRFLINRKVKQYAKKLPQTLIASYGHCKYYTKGQVDAALKHTGTGAGTYKGMATDYYAYAMFCSEKEFSEINKNAGESYDYATLRDSVFNTVFSESMSSFGGSGSYDGSGEGSGGGDSGSSI